ncbi:hypothetical protein BC829DRAFT_434082, partial [Chytridium lagenaria]
MIGNMKDVLAQDDAVLKADLVSSKLLERTPRLGAGSVIVSENGQNARKPDGTAFNSGGYHDANTGMIGFGTGFYSGSNDKDRAGALIHEAAHALGGKDDDGKTKVVDHQYAEHMSFATMKEGGGAGDAYNAALSTKDMSLNADSYRIFAGLCSGRKSCKKRVADMNQQMKKTAVMNKDGTLDVKATLAAAKKTKQSLAKTNADRKAGGKKLLPFPLKKTLLRLLSGKRILSPTQLVRREESPHSSSSAWWKKQVEKGKKSGEKKDSAGKKAAVKKASAGKTPAKKVPAGKKVPAEKKTPAGKNAPGGKKTPAGRMLPGRRHLLERMLPREEDTCWEECSREEDTCWKE